MPVDFEHIDRFLREKDLHNPTLKVLIPDMNQYRTLAYQHKGEVEASRADDLFIRNRNRTLIVSQFDAFFEKALAEEVDLVITPEYSCPWDSVSKILRNNSLPENGSIWMIACESIKPKEFKEFIGNHNDYATMIFENEAYTDSENKFLDPIIYFFKSKSTVSDEYKDVLTFQFKTEPMGAEFEYEADNMQPGSTRYIIRNDVASISLITLICSESLSFNSRQRAQRALNFENMPYLILHAQLNFNPRSANFINYRTSMYNNMAESVIDLICLNWAIGSSINGNEIATSNSALYMKSSAVTENIDETRIQDNDKLGLHYHYWKDARAGIFVLNYSLELTLYENFKASQRSMSAQQNRARRGPKMLKIWKWNNDEFVDVNEIDNSELRDSCELIGDEFEYFLNDTIPAINRERLLSLSTGKIGSPKWTKPTENALFEMLNDEKSHRITLIQDPETRAYKDVLLSKYKSLVNRFEDPDNIPSDSNVTDLKNNCQVRYHSDELSYNVVGSSNIPACLVWAGDMPLSRVKQIKNDISKSINCENANKSKRILIWYIDGAMIKPEYDRSAPKIRDNSSKNPTSFKKMPNHDSH
ncbi:MAG: hypothetical protein HQ507_00595 [Candidatus Marinimicrobia bacterium]|nr:hypothetical protein [Candidatus Neomarinimicrobiota bacterium]